MSNKKNKALVVTGGKSFEEESFFKIFTALEMSFDSISKPSAFDLFKSEEIKKYGAIIFYDFYQPIDEDQKKAFLRIFELGIGVVFLHHALVSHQDWEEYENIIGGKYFFTPYVEDGKKFGPSTYKHDQDFRLVVLDKDHPVTKGIGDFDLHDEIYINYRIHKNVTPLLSSNNCESGKYLGWVKIYMNSKVVYIQPGHDHFTFENKNFRKLILNSIHWVSE